MSRILIVCYSRTGNTAMVAEALAQACGADIERIEDTRHRGGLWGWLRSGREAWQGRSGAIAPVEKDPGEYDLVILGSPVWAGHVSSPMRGYLEGHVGKFSRIALFVTEGGSGGAKAFTEMAALAGSAPVATLELTEKELKSGMQEQLARFVEALDPSA